MNEATKSRSNGREIIPPAIKGSIVLDNSGMGLQLCKPMLRLATSSRWPRVLISGPATQRHASRLNSPFLEVSEEVQAAVTARMPVVALETTIYTHGRSAHPPGSLLALTPLDQAFHILKTANWPLTWSLLCANMGLPQLQSEFSMVLLGWA